MKNHRNNKAFTLIELIIVIAIIAILSTLGFSAYNNIQRQARDTKRVGDVDKLMKAINVYKLQTGSMPGEGDTSGIVISSGCTSDLMTDLLNSEALEAPLEDPVNDPTSCGVSDSTSGVDDMYFYAWDSVHCTPAGQQNKACFGINNLETQWGIDKLIEKYGTQHDTNCGGQGNIDGAGDGNISNSGAESFNYCF